MRIAAGGVERIGDEFFGRQRVALEIAARHAGAADQQFALDAALQQVIGLVGDIAGVIGDGAADGHRRVGLHFRDRGDDGGFGRTVGIEDARGPACTSDWPPPAGRLRRRE